MGSMLVAGLAVAAVVMPAAPATLPDGAVAVVGDQPPITRAAYDHLADVVRRTGTAELEPAPEQVLPALVRLAWLRGEAALRGVTPSPQAVDAAYQEQVRSSFPRPGDLERYLRGSGQTEADLREGAERVLLADRLRALVLDGVAPVPAAQVRRFWRRHRERFDVEERRGTRLVLTDTRRAARAARAALDRGAPFPRVARRWSVDEASRRRGGRMTFGAGDRSRLGLAVTAAPRRELRGPLRLAIGWVVFRVDRVSPARRPPFAEVRGTVRQLLLGEREAAALTRFSRDWQRRWTAVTRCAPDVRTDDCGLG